MTIQDIELFCENTQILGNKQEMKVFPRKTRHCY